MRNLAAILVMTLLFAAPAAAEESLAEAAKESRSKRKKSTTRVITNEDVAKSKGKLVETTGGAPQESLPPPESLVETYEAARAERAAAEERLRGIESRIAALARELTALEQQYFEENDLTRRDTVIARRFGEVREKLESAMAELEGAEPQP